MVSGTRDVLLIGYSWILICRDQYVFLAKLRCRCYTANMNIYITGIILHEIGALPSRDIALLPEPVSLHKGVRWLFYSHITL